MWLGGWMVGGLYKTAFIVGLSVTMMLVDCNVFFLKKQ